MGRHDHGDLPPELSYVADQLRSHRYEASALELDQAKTRILKRAGGQRVARGGRMRKRSLLTAVIMIAAIATGSSAALAVGGVSPFRNLFTPRTHVVRLAPTRLAPSAALAQYGCPPTSFPCNLIVSHLQRLEQRFPFLAPIVNRVINLIISIFGGVPFPNLRF
jgi:hypothetical protein